MFFPTFEVLKLVALQTSLHIRLAYTRSKAEATKRSLSSHSTLATCSKQDFRSLAYHAAAEYIAEYNDRLVTHHFLHEMFPNADSSVNVERLKNAM